MYPSEASMFGDRGSRASFWSGLLVYLILLFVIMIPINGLANTGICTSKTTNYLVTAALVLASYPFTRIAGRRFHDLGWSGWFALVFPLFVSLRYEFAFEGATYYCNAGALNSISDVLPNAAFQFLSEWTAFNVTLNGTTIEMASVGVPVVIYLGFFRGQKGANAYGADPLPAKQVTAAVQG